MHRKSIEVQTNEAYLYVYVNIFERIKKVFIIGGAH